MLFVWEVLVSMGVYRLSCPMTPCMVKFPMLYVARRETTEQHQCAVCTAVYWGHCKHTVWGVAIAGRSVAPEYAAMSLGRWFLGNGAVSWGWVVVGFGAVCEGEWLWNVALCLGVSGCRMWRCVLGWVVVWCGAVSQRVILQKAGIFKYCF